MTSKFQYQILAANQSYAAQFGNRKSLTSTPKRSLAVLTCMDARMDPFEFAGISLGEAHIIRNAGGRASDDAIRSLLVSHKFFGTNTWLVVQHTRCGMQTVSDSEISQLFAQSLQPATNEGGSWRNTADGTGSEIGKEVHWLTIDNLEESLRADVHRIANHPLVSPAISIYGCIYDVDNGQLKYVEGAERKGNSR